MMRGVQFQNFVDHRPALAAVDVRDVGGELIQRGLGGFDPLLLSAVAARGWSSWRASRAHAMDSLSGESPGAHGNCERSAVGHVPAGCALGGDGVADAVGPSLVGYAAPLRAARERERLPPDARQT